MSGLEPSSISFPLRKIFQKKGYPHPDGGSGRSFPEEKYLLTNIGRCNFDMLVISIGARTNFLQQPNIEKYAFSLKKHR